MPLRRLALTAVTASLALTAPAASVMAATDWPPAQWHSEAGTDHPLTGQVYDVAAKTLIDPATALTRIASARFVLAGERHDNPDHHVVQATVLQAMIDAGRKPAVVFEMIDEDQAPALAEALAGGSADPAALGPAVRWEERGWPAWSMYQVIAEAALPAGLPLATGNLSKAAVKALAFEGWDALPAAQRERLKVEAALPESVAAAHRKAVVEGHCGMLPESAAGPMARVQAAKDSVMAAALLDGGGSTDGAVLIAGNGHVRADVGVPFQLRRLGGDDLLAVAAQEVQADETDPAAYGAAYGADAPPFDYIFFTPAIDTTDPCETYKDQLQRAGDRLKTQGD